MKKKILFASAMLFFSILPMLLFTSCDKDTNSYLEVLVLDDATKNPIPAANVDITQSGGGTIQVHGITGNDGIFKASFKSPAIIKVKASLPIPIEQGGGERRGETQVRLLEGETLTAKISLTDQVYF
ncbi:MAG: hypothetical protein J6X59_07765 [Bacteroidales bacterium]|nr:hypothetical protein [Bacteroidales bacterium]